MLGVHGADDGDDDALKSKNITEIAQQFNNHYDLSLLIPFQFILERKSNKCEEVKMMENKQ